MSSNSKVLSKFEVFEDKYSDLRKAVFSDAISKGKYSVDCDYVDSIIIKQYNTLGTVQAVFKTYNISII